MDPSEYIPKEVRLVTADRIVTIPWDVLPRMVQLHLRTYVTASHISAHSKKSGKGDEDRDMVAYLPTGLEKVNVET